MSTKIVLFFIKLTFLMCISLFIVQLNSAFAQELEAAPESLVLVGKGIQNKENQNTIALACLEPSTNDCKQIRLVEFENGTPHWLGPAYQVDSLRPLIEEFKVAYRKANRIHLGVKLNPKKVAAVSAGAYFTAAGIVLAQAGGTVAIGTLVGGVALPLAGFIAFMALSKHDIDALGGALTFALSPVESFGDAVHDLQFSVLSNQEGWSWASRPQLISARKYAKLKVSLLSALEQK